MNREKEINKAASEYTKNYDCFYGDIADAWEGFVDGAKWADVWYLRKISRTEMCCTLYTTI